MVLFCILMPTIRCCLPQSRPRLLCFFPPPLLSSPLCPSALLLTAPLWNDLRHYNYWVISTVITLNICSVTMLRAFGCAQPELFYVLTVLWCWQTTPTLCCLLSLWSLCIGEMKWPFYEWEQSAVLIYWSLKVRDTSSVWLDGWVLLCRPVISIPSNLSILDRTVL